MTKLQTLQSMLSRANWAAILLFSALLAQAPHAAWVFLRIAPHDDTAGFSVAIALAILGAVVYAIALEGATAYFVWHYAGRIAVAFAVFSFLHNVAYYMPVEWGVYAWGAWLTVRFILSMLLISASLPIAIAAFSHVQASRANAKPPAIAVQIPVQTQTPELSQPEIVPFAVQTPAQAVAKPDSATRRSAKAAGDCERAGQRFREMGRAKKGGGMMSEWEKSQEARIEGLRAQLAERSREIAELRAAIVRLCGNAKTTLDLNEWLEIYAPEQWFAGYDVAESALMALKDYSESIVYLRAQLAAVPVAQLRRQYSIESMTVHDFGLDAQDVDAWLRSLDGVGGHGNEAP